MQGSELVRVRLRATRKWRRRHFPELLEQLARLAFDELHIAPVEYSIEAEEIAPANGRRHQSVWLVRVTWVRGHDPLGP